MERLGRRWRVAGYRVAKRAPGLSFARFCGCLPARTRFVSSATCCSPSGTKARECQRGTAHAASKTNQNHPRGREVASGTHPGRDEVERRGAGDVWMWRRQ